MYGLGVFWGYLFFVQLMVIWYGNLPEEVSFLGRRFATACKRYGIAAGRDRQSLDCSQFRRPGQRQMALGFD